MSETRKIAVLMGGDSSEREISLKSGDAVLRALLNGGYRAEAVDLPAGLHRLAAGEYGAAFIALHGRKGEDGCIQGLLELLEIPYTGSGVLASAATMDKAFAKRIMAAEGIPTPLYEVFEVNGEDPEEVAVSLDFPVIVKPASEGSTIGIRKAENSEDFKEAFREAARYDRKVLAERFIAGREVTVSVVDGTVYPVVEVAPKNGFYDYEAKYTKGMTEYIVPADLDDALTGQVKELALRVYRLFGCRGAARVDIMLGTEGPTVLEINTVPGMTETSLLPKAAAAAGIGFGELVSMIVEGASLDGRSAPEKLLNALERGEESKKGIAC